jgi:hypothetical protein
VHISRHLATPDSRCSEVIVNGHVAIISCPDDAWRLAFVGAHDTNHSVATRYFMQPPSLFQ